MKLILNWFYRFRIFDLNIRGIQSQFQYDLSEKYYFFKRFVSFMTKYSRKERLKSVEDSLQKIWSEMVCLSRPYHLKIFLRLSSTNFTWSILEYFFPFKARDFIKSSSFLLQYITTAKHKSFFQLIHWRVISTTYIFFRFQIFYFFYFRNFQNS